MVPTFFRLVWRDRVAGHCDQLDFEPSSIAVEQVQLMESSAVAMRRVDPERNQLPFVGHSAPLPTNRKSLRTRRLPADRRYGLFAPPEHIFRARQGVEQQTNG